MYGSKSEWIWWCWGATSISRQMQKWAVNFKLQFFPICIHLNLSKPDTDILNVKIRWFLGKFWKLFLTGHCSITLGESQILSLTKNGHTVAENFLKSSNFITLFFSPDFSLRLELGYTRLNPPTIATIL